MRRRNYFSKNNIWMNPLTKGIYSESHSPSKWKTSLIRPECKIYSGHALCLMTPSSNWSHWYERQFTVPNGMNGLCFLKNSFQLKQDLRSLIHAWAYLSTYHNMYACSLFLWIINFSILYFFILLLVLNT